MQVATIHMEDKYLLNKDKYDKMVQLRVLIEDDKVDKQVAMKTVGITEEECINWMQMLSLQMLTIEYEMELVEATYNPDEWCDQSQTQGTITMKWGAVRDCPGLEESSYADMVVDGVRKQLADWEEKYGAQLEADVRKCLNHPAGKKVALSEGEKRFARAFGAKLEEDDEACSEQPYTGKA